MCKTASRKHAAKRKFPFYFMVPKRKEILYVVTPLLMQQVKSPVQATHDIRKFFNQLQVQEPAYGTVGFKVCFLSSDHKRTEGKTMLFLLECKNASPDVISSQFLFTSLQDKSQRFLQVTGATSLQHHFSYLAVMCNLKRTFHVHSSLFHLFKLHTPALKPTAALMKLN